MRNLRRTLWGLAIVELVYLVAANGFLNSGVIQRLINTDKDKIRIEYGLAYTILPAVVHLRALRFWIQDNNIQIHFALPSVAVVVNPFAFAKKQFHALSVRGDDLRFLFRFRRKPEEAVKLEMEEYPHLPEVLTILKPTPTPDDGSPPWQLRLDGVHISSIRELWFERYRYVGPASVRGGMYLYPSKLAEVYPAVVEFGGGDVNVAEVPAATGVKGVIEAKIDRFDGDKVPDLELLRYTKAHVRLSAKVTTIPLVESYLAKNPWLKHLTGHGSLESDVRIDKGIVKAPSYFRVAAEEIEAAVLKQKIRGGGQVEWLADTDEAQSFGVLFADFQLVHQDHPTWKIVGNGLKASLVSKNLSMLESFTPFAFDFDLPKARITDLRYVNAYLPAGGRTKLEGGTGDLEAKLHLSSEPRRDHGYFRVAAKEAQLRYGKKDIAGDAKVKLLLEKSDIAQGTLDFKGSTVELTRVRGSESDRVWWGKLSLPVALLNLGRNRSAEVEASLMGKDARPILEMIVGDGLPGWASGIVAFPDLKLEARMEVDEEELRVTRVNAEGGANKLWGHLTVNENGKEGRVLVKAGPLAAGVEFDGKDSHLKLNDAYKWYFGKNDFRVRRSPR